MSRVSASLPHGAARVNDADGVASCDVHPVALKPEPMARMAVADALASRRALSYRLQGKVTATPDEASKPRPFELDERSSLNPAPGLDGVLR